MKASILATAHITPDNDAVVTEIDIAAPPERVFRAITEIEQAKQWGGGKDYEVLLWEIDARPGGKWRFVSRERKGKNPPGLDRLEHHGEFIEFDPPRLLVETWYANWHSDPSHRTIVRWEFMPTKTGTHLKVTHSGLAPIAGLAKDYSQGWPGLVEQVKHFVEKH